MVGRWECAALCDTVMTPELADSKPFASSFFAMRVEKSWRLVRGLVSIFLTTLRLNAWIALDPTPAMVERSLPRTTQVAVPIGVIVANAEALPFPDHTFDTVVGTLVFCTIPDPCQALCEMAHL